MCYEGFESFELVKKLGGDDAYVYAVREKESGDYFALKVHSRLDIEVYKTDIITELQFTKLMNSPFVIKMSGRVYHDTFVGLVLEFSALGSLKKYIKDKVLKFAPEYIFICRVEFQYLN